MSDASVQQWPENTQRLRLGDIEFDLRFRSVRRCDRVHELSQRCFDLLMLFLREPGVVHTREEIFRRVWGGAVVEDANITTSIWLLRRALGESAKGWIKTVSKQGYVFDPPGVLEPSPLAEAPAEAAVETTTEVASPEPPSSESAGVEPAGRMNEAAAVAAQPRAWLAWAWRAAGTVAALAAMLLLAVFLFPQGRATVSRVVLVAPADAALTAEARWPAELLHGWLDWQLRSLSQRIAVAEQVGGDDNSDAVVVLLRVTMPAGRDGEWQVSADFHGGAELRPIRLSSAPDRLVATIDEVSRRVIAALVPDLPPRPPLALEAQPAADLVHGLAAEQRRRWNDAVTAYRKVLGTAPEFSPARLHLARCLAELGQFNAAQSELDVAEPWIQRLPAELQPALRAQALAIRQNYVGAAEAYGQLWKTSLGDRPDYRLAEATNLRKAGFSRDAFERLAGPVPATPARALPWLIERTEIELANRDVARARETAADAIDLARQLGWEQERAQATLLLVNALVATQAVVDQDLFADAVAGFEASGDHIGVLRAQFYRDLFGSTEPSAPPQHLDTLLAEARAAGNVAVEIDALRRSAQYYYRSGEVSEGRERFEQALAVAESSGDVYQRRLVELNLLFLDARSTDTERMQQRLRRLRAESLQGSLAFGVGLVTARDKFRRGEFDAALAAVAATEEQLRATEARSLPQVAAALACMRATVYIPQGRMADASTAVQACRSPDLPYFTRYADIGEAELDILAGDLPSARKRLESVLVQVEKETVQPDRWSLLAEVAPLLTQTGEAHRARALIEAVLADVERSGLHTTEGDMRSAMAEVDLAEGRLADAEVQLQKAAKLLGAEDWIGQRRLRTLQVLIEQGRGHDRPAMAVLIALHDESREHQDVLTELLTHSLAREHLSELCSPERHARLLAQSGMRGANLAWLLPPATRVAQAALLRK